MLTTYLKLLCVPAIWGATFIAGRIASANLPPATSGFIRFLFALAALFWRANIFARKPDFAYRGFEPGRDDVVCLCIFA
jgi:drug/metabolite transporter (DMT)-like permease